MLLEHTFRSLNLAGLYRVPSYQEWALACDMRPAYRYFLRVLKLLQWRRPPTRWNLKNPIDLFHLDALVDEVPDVRLIWAHRDPVKSVPSVASLLAARRRPFTDSNDPVEIGRQELDLRAEQIRRGMCFRPPAGAAPIVHLANRDLTRDPVNTVRHLYAELGIEFTSAAENALHTRVADRPRGKFGAHDYTAAQFGLERDELQMRFAAYIERFRVMID
jgi:hypothetical protein